MTNEEIINSAVKTLNEAYAADPAAVYALVTQKVPCNTALADHPTIVASECKTVPHPTSAVSPIGLLNGVLMAMCGEKIAHRWSPPDADNRRTLMNFERYKPPTGTDDSTEWRPVSQQ